MSLNELIAGLQLMQSQTVFRVLKKCSFCAGRFSHKTVVSVLVINRSRSLMYGLRVNACSLIHLVIRSESG